MPYRTRVALVYLLGFFVDLITMFIANIAYPAIGRALHASVNQLAWVSTGYILGLTLVIPLSAWLAQRIGARRVFLLSLTVFILATAAAGFAGTIGALIGWRVLQGIGGGLLIPIGQTLTYQLYRSHERARLSAAIMLVGLLAPALSPLLGGSSSIAWSGAGYSSPICRWRYWRCCCPPCGYAVMHRRRSVRRWMSGDCSAPALP